MCPPEEVAEDTEKHPQSMSRPRTELKTSEPKNTRKRALQISTAPGNQKPKINKRPRSNSSQGRMTEVRLMRVSGRT